jgi:hypothetical protein
MLVITGKWVSSASERADGSRSRMSGIEEIERVAEMNGGTTAWPRLDRDRRFHAENETFWDR